MLEKDGRRALGLVQLVAVVARIGESSERMTKRPKPKGCKPDLDMVIQARADHEGGCGVGEERDKTLVERQDQER